MLDQTDVLCWFGVPLILRMTFLWRGDRRTTAILFAVAILIPIGPKYRTELLRAA
jgi:hypothetical protein